MGQTHTIYSRQRIGRKAVSYKEQRVPPSLLVPAKGRGSTGVTGGGPGHCLDHIRQEHHQVSQVTRLFRAPSSPHCCSETHRVDKAPAWAQPALTPTCTRVCAWHARPWALSLPEEGKDPQYGASAGAGAAPVG